MNNQQILTKAIEKAITNGWGGFYFGKQEVAHGVGDNEWWATDHHFCYRIDGRDEYVPYVAVIFSHDFAHALWGDEPSGSLYYIKELTDSSSTFEKHLLPTWQYHLQQMVIAEDPIEYLGANI